MLSRARFVERRSRELPGEVEERGEKRDRAEDEIESRGARGRSIGPAIEPVSEETDSAGEKDERHAHGVSNGRVGERLETRLRETAQGGYARKRLRLSPGLRNRGCGPEQGGPRNARVNLIVGRRLARELLPKLLPT